MDPRILDLSFHRAREFQRILDDAATPPVDAHDMLLALQELAGAYDPRTLLLVLPECPGVVEFVMTASTSGHRYGMLFIDMGYAADAVAYWRDPPLLVDPRTNRPHGSSRAHAIELAGRRLERMR